MSWAVMSSAFIRWRKERERVEKVVVFLMFWSLLVEGCRSRDEARLSERIGNELASTWYVHPVSDRIKMSNG